MDGLDKILKQNAASKLMKYWTLQFANPFRFLGTGDDRKKKEGEEGGEQAGYRYVMAECCNPIPGDEVVGFKMDDGRVEVHRKTAIMRSSYRPSMGNGSCRSNGRARR